MKTGAKILIKGLIKQGVTTIFGYPGSTVLPIYDELPNSGLQHILVRHEQAAAHAADGYARATGQVGVCLATSGPGACNLVTGIATAYMDSIPIIALTGQVPTTMIGNDAFQEADIIGITKPITKQNYLVRTTSELSGVLDEAFHVARTGRPGPVLIDIPKDVSTGYGYNDCQKRANRQLQRHTPFPSLDPGIIVRAAEMIQQAAQPVIYAGGGAISSQAAAEIRILAETVSIPVTTTLLGLGLIPADHPLNMGMVGMHGTVAANHAVSQCDLLVAVGARFSDRVCGTSGTFAPHASVIHIDIDPGEIGKNKPVDIPLVGDAKTILQQIIRQITMTRRTGLWLNKIKLWKKQALISDPDDGCLHPQCVIRSLSRILNGNGIIVSEVGQNQMWTAQHFAFFKPRSFLTSGGLGTMGFGLPAAMGAYFARPDQTICTIAGDGSLQMNIQELATLAEYKIPVKIFILNNGYLGMVRQWQELFYDRRYSFTELPSLDFTRIAAAYGIEGMKVESPDMVDSSIQAALDTDTPFLIDFRIEREENVFPMIPAGCQNHEMILE